MFFIQISLTTKCNLACEYCPITQYRNITPRWPLNNEELIPFLERGLSKLECGLDEVVVELTGGEPALYEGIEELLDYLTEKHIITVIKTNGLLEIKPRDGVVRAAAFHNLNNPPKYYDKILIIQDTPDFMAKVKYCKDNGIDYTVIAKDHNGDKSAYNGFEYGTYINPAGHNCKCQAYDPVQKLSEDGSVDYNRIPFLDKFEDGISCPDCKAAIDAWRFVL